MVVGTITTSQRRVIGLVHSGLAHAITVLTGNHGHKKSPPRSRAERPNGFDCVGVQDRMDGIEDSQCREYPFQDVVMIPMTGA
jgi:hypothetical protein